MKASHLLVIALTFISSILNAQNVIINEIDADTEGTDILEFIELKTPSPNQSLNGYIIVLYTGNGDISYRTIDLNGYSTDANGFILIGNSGVSPTPSITFPSNTLQNGEDAVVVYQDDAANFPNGTAVTSTNMIDALVYDTDDPDDTGLMSTLGVSVQINENENGDKNNHSIQRNNSGGYDVKTPTPGQENDGSTSNTKYRVTISSTASEYTEGDNFDITFTSDVATEEDVTIEFTLTNGNFNSSDFSSVTQVTLSNGSTTNSINVSTNDDSDAEGNEYLKVTCTTYPQDVTLLNNNYSIKINDNDVSGSSWGTPLNPTYDQVTSTASANYYGTLSGNSGQDLRDAIRGIIADPAVVRAQNYGDVWTIVKEADEDPSNSLSIWMIYSEEGRSKDLQQTGSTSTGYWNREHIYPQSRGGYSNGTSTSADGIDNYMSSSADHTQHGHSDAHAIRPADFTQNSIRSNKDFGEEYNGPSGNQGSWKGDVARSVFFMALRYNALDVVSGNPGNSTVGQLGDLDSLLVWHRNDPPDDYEMNRNNVIYNWQMNRNPFIDLPELVEYIWGDQIGETWDSGVGINELPIDRESISIYPNPATTQINHNVDGEGKYFILSIGGKLIHEGILNKNQIDIQSLKTGIYILKIKTDNKIHTGRFIKQ